MEIKTRFITKEDYLDYYGEDLDYLLNDHNGDRFIMLVEDELDAYLNAKVGIDLNILIPRLNQNQKLLFKKAILSQVNYVFTNGNIANDSGYSQEKGKIISREQLDNLIIAPKCKYFLQQAGIWNLHIGGRAWYNII